MEQPTYTQHFNRLNGKPKRELTKEQAERRAHDQRMVAYLCGWCKRWHLATPADKRRDLSAD